MEVNEEHLQTRLARLVRVSEKLIVATKNHLETGAKWAEGMGAEAIPVLERDKYLYFALEEYVESVGELLLELMTPP